MPAKVWCFMFYVRKMAQDVYNSVMFYVRKNDPWCVQQCDVLYPHKWHRVCAITSCIMSTKWHRVCTTVWCFMSAKMTQGMYNNVIFMSTKWHRVCTTVWFLCPQNDTGCFYNIVTFYARKSVMFYVLKITQCDVLCPQNDTGCVQQCDVLCPQNDARCVQHSVGTNGTNGSYRIDNTGCCAMQNHMTLCVCVCVCGGGGDTTGKGYNRACT